MPASRCCACALPACTAAATHHICVDILALRPPTHPPTHPSPSMRSYIKGVSSDVEYLNSRDATIMGSRNGHAPIYMWWVARGGSGEGAGTCRAWPDGAGAGPSSSHAGVLLPAVTPACWCGGTLMATPRRPPPSSHPPPTRRYTFTRKGYEGLRKDVEKCLRNAHLLKVGCCAAAGLTCDCRCAGWKWRVEGASYPHSPACTCSCSRLPCPALFAVDAGEGGREGHAERAVLDRRV